MRGPLYFSGVGLLVSADVRGPTSDA